MSGLSLVHLKYEVVEPTLVTLGLMSTSALNLVTGTALAESGCQYLRQIDGPALGLWQMEPATYNDCFVNFLAYNHDLKARLMSVCAPYATTEPSDQLTWNLKLGAAMARIKYYRSPAMLPSAKDAIGLADLHKSVYNSAAGKANSLVNIPLFQLAIDA